MKASKAPIEGEIRKRFDQHLLTLKLHEPTLKMHEEVSASSRQIYAEYAKGGPQRSDLYIRLIDGELAILEKSSVSLTAYPARCGKYRATPLRLNLSVPYHTCLSWT
jgi:hypothetical protein